MSQQAPPIQLIASGDSRLPANRLCWPAQQRMEAQLGEAVRSLGFTIERAHPETADGHGFIDSQKRGLEVFRGIDPGAPLIVAEAVWQYTHHVLAGLTTHRGPILTVANWSGQWPGLVGMLNLNGSLTKAGVHYSTLWSEDFKDEYFLSRLRQWLETGQCQRSLEHVVPLERVLIPEELVLLGERLAADLRDHKSIMGVFDEGCMGMFNAIIPDHLLNPTGVFKERLSQSALYFESGEVSDGEAAAVFQWYREQGFQFHFGGDEAVDLTEQQVIAQ